MLLFVYDSDPAICAQITHVAQVAEATAVRSFASLEAMRGALALAVGTNRNLPGLIVLEFDPPPPSAEEGAGATLCRWVKSLPMLKDVPIVALADEHDNQAELRAFAAGAGECIRKPINPFELKARLPAAIRTGKLLAARKVTEAELRRELVFSEAILESLSNMGQGFLVVEQGRITYVNAALCALTGYSPDDLYNMTSFIELFHPDEGDRLMLNHQRRIAGEQFETCYDTALCDRGGHRIDISFSVALFHCVTHHGVACLVRDIRVQIDMQRQLRTLADFDSLTGLPNRRVLIDRLTHALQRATRTGTKLAVLFIDLDGFKAVNDQLGHAAGDALLRIAAERLRLAVRASDTVARLAGDEFIVILEPDPETGIDPIAVTEKLLAQIAIPYPLAEGVGRVSASIGVVVTHGRQKTADSVLQAADQAMYRAKSAGKNGYAVIADDPPTLSPDPH